MCCQHTTMQQKSYLTLSAVHSNNKHVKLTCSVQWFCIEQPRSSSSQVPLWHSWPLPPAECPHSKQLAMGASEPRCCSVCPFRHRAVALPRPLSLLIGSLTLIDVDSRGSQWHLLLSQPMRRERVPDSRGSLCTSLDRDGAHFKKSDIVLFDFPLFKTFKKQVFS
ncbi:hypothetical protein AB205_0002350 [Aquarana catesbeiana]|uniref:Uncharacterized protein n=1 Tax=Aquarana catesbeiana TaxID=8400 RepID=A0A2G9RN59_AQUCT|nr:hypothetical protein AB205_0002350 [Aquarana catesbeiana]